MKKCEVCGTEHGVHAYDYNEDGYPTLINGTDVTLCLSHWNEQMNNIFIK